ncbi:MAG: energy transducer TonB [Alphaproteobacteria bacterium]|nr:energy transducer TonB [Alphaproteobacteria bacterium]
MAKHLVGGLALALALIGATATRADTAPHVDHNYAAPQPAYPAGAQSAGEQGDVILSVYVSANGHAHKLRLKKSSGFHDLDMAAAEGVLNWRYIPAMSGGGEPYSDWLDVTIHYELPPAAQGAQPASATSQVY